MKGRYLEHAISIFLVTSIFVGLIYYVQKNVAAMKPVADPRLQEYLNLGFIDFGDPLDKALFKETLDIFSPDYLARNNFLLQSIEDLRREQFANALYKTGGELRGLTVEKAQQLLVMYLQFIFVYIIVMSLSYYGAQTLGILRFILMKQNRSSYLLRLFTDPPSSLPRMVGQRISLFLKACVKGVAYIILFSPAYVIAYSFKTEFATDSYFFMVLLGIVSNGLLINYANRFYTFLVSESRRGYVETAIVKNLHNSYAWHDPEGIALKSVFRLRKAFPSHVFQHMYINARRQFQPTLKEHASFLITGLVIIEMALNIQGHLSYEMLKNILYKQYDVVLGIILGIFLLVKATEILVDVWIIRQAKKYGDIPA